MSSNNDAGSGSDVAPGDFTIAADPTTLTIPIAGSATVAVTVSASGVGDITLSAEGLGTNLEVTFDPAVIPAGETTSTATIRVKGGTAAGTSTVMLTGTAGSITHSASVSVTSTTITVSGTIRGARSGVIVGIIGKNSTVSAAGGVFSFVDVTPPYDLYTVADGGCSAPINSVGEIVYFFDDLTRPDPVVTAAATTTCSLSAGCSGTCDATVTSARSGVGNGTDTMVMAWGPGDYVLGSYTANSISGTASWRSGATSTGMLYALQFTKKASGAPDSYLGFARSASKVLTGGSPDTIPLNFVTVGSVFTLTGTVSAPAGYPSPKIQLRQELGTAVEDLWETTTTTTVDATIPVIANAGGTTLYATSQLDGGTVEYIHPLTANTTLNFVMPAAALQIAPADDTTGVTTTTQFTWTPAPNTISQVSFTGATGGNKARYYVFTTASQTTIPSIPEAPLGSGLSFNWRVEGYGPHTDINDAAAPNELETVSTIDFQGPAHAHTRSTVRGFTTP